MKYYNEVRSGKIRIAPLCLVPAEDLHKYTGFHSMYSFTEQLTLNMLIAGNTQGLDMEEVYSKILYLDYDDAPEDAHNFSLLLRERGIRFNRFDSGGRSVHFHVAIEPMFGVDVPYSQKEWTEKNAPGRDGTIYRHSAMFRLEGTVHSKTRKQKVFTYGHDGDLLKIPVAKNEAPTKKAYKALMNADEHKNIVGYLMMQEVSEGGEGRSPHAFKIAKHCRDAGIDSYEALKFVSMWNDCSCYPPLNRNILDSLVRSAYK